MTGSTAGNVPQSDNSNAPSPPLPPALRNLELLLWGAAGGVLSVLAANGLFERQSIEAMLTGSAPVAQLTTLCILSAVTAFVGGLWTVVHRPIHSIKVAVQLGIIAPVAINAMIALSNDNTKPTAGLNLFDNILISSAYANPAQQPTTPRKPTTMECIIKAAIKKPC